MTSSVSHQNHNSTRLEAYHATSSNKNCQLQLSNPWSEFLILSLFFQKLTVRKLPCDPCPIATASEENKLYLYARSPSPVFLFLLLTFFSPDPSLNPFIRLPTWCSRPVLPPPSRCRSQCGCPSAGHLPILDKQETKRRRTRARKQEKRKNPAAMTAAVIQNITGFLGRRCC